MTGLTLDRLQREMTRYILREAGTDALAEQIRQPPRDDPADASMGGKLARLEIYHNAYLERLRQVLQRDYPVLELLLGAQDFVALSYAYACAQPSHDPNIRWFGRHLAEFLVVNGGWDEHPAVADMARLEWALGLAFDAADAPLLQIDDLAALPAQAWPGLRFSLHPSLHLLALAYNVADFWLAARDLEPAAPAAPQPEPLPMRARNWAVWRGAGQVQFRQLAPDESEAIWALRGGADFAALCALLARHGGEAEAPLRAAGLLRNWIEAGWISALLAD